MFTLCEQTYLVNDMARRRTETQLINRIIDTFHELTPIRLEVEPPAELTHGEGQVRTDGNLYLRMPNGRTVGPLAVEIKPKIDRAEFGQIYRYATIPGLPAIVATEYVNPQMAATMAEANVLFIDAAGNALINAGDVYVFITGRKPPTTYQRRQPPTRAFRAAGLRLILALLDDEELLNMPYRAIAEVTGVALGTITNVFNDLEELGYLQTVGKKRRLRNFDDLLHKWADAYIEKARDKQIIGRFTAENWRNWTDQDLKLAGAWWGGEVAAAKMTDYLKPETATIYLDGPPGHFQARFGLKRDPNGTLELLENFWPKRMHRDLQCAPPIVVYADLLTIGDDRTLETAKILYEKHLTVHRR